MTSDVPDSNARLGGATASVVHIGVASRQARRRPRTVIRDSIKRLGIQGKWTFVTQRGPAVMPFAANLGRYLSESVPTGNGVQPLLDQCLSRGVNDWLKIHGRGRSEQQRFLAFIRGVLYPLPEALEWTLSRSDGEHIAVWNPMEQCVMDWLTGSGGAPEVTRRNRPADSAYVALNPADYRLIVLVRFLARKQISLTPLSAWLDDLVTRYP